LSGAIAAITAFGLKTLQIDVSLPVIIENALYSAMRNGAIAQHAPQTMAQSDKSQHRQQALYMEPVAALIGTSYHGLDAKPYFHCR